MNPAGEIIKHSRFPNDRDALEAFLGPYAGASCKAVLEAGRTWCVMHDWLEELTGEVVLAHPLKVRAIAEAKVKTDKVDATTLAHLLRCDLVPRAHVSSPPARALKNLLRHRMFLVQVQTMTKNRIHVLLDRHPQIRTPSGVGLFSRAGLEWLKQLGLRAPDQEILQSEVVFLEHLVEQIRQSNRLLRDVGRCDPRVERVMTIPGLGRIFSLVILSEIDDIGRFATPKKLHAYAGLVPSTYSSGGRTHHGRIIKGANKYLRWAMVEAVWPARRKDADIDAYYLRIARRKAPNSAKIATARRLLTIVYRVLKEDRDYQQTTRHGGPQTLAS